MTVATPKTKRNLIEVARQLFAKKGVDSTTMNEIAEASGYGRRTLYTYFKNKKDVYKAVIGSELQKLYAALEDVIKRDLPADDKLMMFTFSRLSIIKEVVTRNGTLRADFFRDIWLVENVRKEFDKKEIHYLETILADGSKSAVFTVNDIPRTAEILHFALKGLEVPVIRGVLNLRLDRQEDREIVYNLVFKGLNKR
ncbi:MAG: TetR/AcrR family transcriptional regulator [Petrimonas sp.]|jgi:AcrR family transcriptional regulator|uniref:TetR/AcrR family transcriptional regulator n=1 Tax=Petrimonas TaxID=307628 RepID=UPI000E95C190|nr:TetR/AcrR family transcriptional regulator [Petrimonas sp.]NLU30434.1 TetR/AcrR family transcriptional regulator [Bacteroidales bacterium]BBD45724.1 Transcriptional regulator TetR family [Petrimonas sp. IBARAKI]HAC74065.1 TetR family transcriptional regulator [Porphyromonadaceae bacterium]MDD2910603.1 TetR/AcrR family transcriptional regulator [Petrimonas sp.]